MLVPPGTCRAVLAILLLATGVTGWAQVARDTAVELSATVQESPAQITLHWLASSHAIALQKVYRRLKGGPAWIELATPASAALSHTDTTVVPGVSYEYFVYRNFSGTAPAFATGYVNAGIAVPLVESRGRVILLVDDSMAAPLATELAQLAQDLAGDGWLVLRQDIARTASVASVKAAITALYQLDPAQTRALILFGRIPVPYSGDVFPDAHPDHLGAWPADVFYGDMNGVWTDAAVNRTTADRNANDNVPGDGKYDQSVLPGDVELQVGRIDLSTIYAASAGASETELLRQYLNRDHDFRHRAGTFASLTPRGLIDDHFGYFGGEAFAASGWRNFTAFFGSAAGSVVEADWFSTLPTAAHLWAYGCGPGSFFSAGGIGTSGDFGTTRSLAVFTMLFGSYFGDWDINDSFLRAPLAGTADSLGLACLWAGRPHWHLHHMALGETIGYGARLSQNNRGSSTSGYVANAAPRSIHLALMGDPTLRLHPFAPASLLTADSSGGLPVLTWTASPDAVAGYRLFRAASAAGPYQPVGNATITGTSYTDLTGVPGQSYHYQVRAVRLETSASGTYWNSAQGAFTTGSFSGPAAREINLRGNGQEIPAGDTVASTMNGTDFGGVPLTSSAIVRTFTIANDGTSALSLTGTPRVQLSGPPDFTVETQPAAAVAGGSSVTFELKFTPQALGERTATVTILNDDPDEGSYTFAIRGTGEAPVPDIDVSPATLTRALAPGASVQVPLTIGNTGGAALQFTLANSQAGYQFRRSDSPGGPAYAWTDISATGTEASGFSHPDDGIAPPIALGFAFPFYGASFTTANLCTNGFLSFTDTTVPFENTGLPSAVAPRNLIAACWDDMILENGARIFTQQLGGEFVVQFDSLQVWGKPSDRITCQIVLKPTGEIRLLYHAVTLVDPLYTVGIQNASRTDGLEIASDAAFAEPGLAVRILPPGLESWLTLSASGGAVPADGMQNVQATLNAAGLAPGIYRASIGVASDDPDTPLVQVPVELTVLSPIQIWRQAHFGTYADSGTGADDANPDFDDLSNLEEYAFTLDPHAGNATGLPVVTRNPAGYLQIEFARHTARTDLIYEVEAGSDLTGWTVIARSTGGAATVALGAHSVGESGPGDVKTVTVEDIAPIAANPRRFLRVQVVR